VRQAARASRRPHAQHVGRLVQRLVDGLAQAPDVGLPPQRGSRQSGATPHRHKPDQRSVAMQFAPIVAPRCPGSSSRPVRNESATDSRQGFYRPTSHDSAVGRPAISPVYSQPVRSANRAPRVSHRLRSPPLLPHASDGGTPCVSPGTVRIIVGARTVSSALGQQVAALDGQVHPVHRG